MYIYPNNTVFFNISFSGSNSVSSSDTYRFEDDMTVNGTWTSGKGHIAGDTTTINFKGNIVSGFSSSAYDTLTFAINGTSDQALSCPIELPNIIINKASNSWTITGSCNLAGSWTHQNGTVVTTGSTITAVDPLTITSNTMAFNNFSILTPASASTITLADNMTLTGNLSIGAKGNLNIGNNTLTVGGSWSNPTPTTVTAGASSTVIFNTSSTATINTGGTGTGQDFQNLTIDKSGGSLQVVTSGLDVDGTLTVTAGTLDLNGMNLSTTTTCNNSATLKLTGDETISCTPTNNTNSTVEYSATLSSRVLKNWTYSNLKINGTGGTFTLPDSNLTLDRTLNVTAGTLNFDNDKNLIIQDGATTGTALTVASGARLINTGTGDLTLHANVANSGVINFESSDESGNGITVGSNTTTKRNWQGSGDFIFEDVIVDYQDCTGGTPASITAWSSTDQGTSTNWLFDARARPVKSGMNLF